MADDIFGAPSTMGVDWKSLQGHLLAIFPYGREVVNTRFGENNAVRADIYDVDAGELVSPDALIFGRALVLQLAGVDPGRAVLGRLGQGEARGGQSPPWIIQNPSEQDYAKARAYFQAHPARATRLLQGQGGQASPSRPPGGPQSAQQAYGTQTHTPQGQGVTSGYYGSTPPPPPWGGSPQGTTDNPPF